MSWNVFLRHSYFILLILLLFSNLHTFLYLTKYKYWRSFAFHCFSTLELSCYWLSMVWWEVLDLLTILSIIGYLNQYEKGEVACIVSCRNLMVCLYSTLGTVKDDLRKGTAEPCFLFIPSIRFFFRLECSKNMY